MGHCLLLVITLLLLVSVHTSSVADKPFAEFTSSDENRGDHAHDHEHDHVHGHEHDHPHDHEHDHAHDLEHDHENDHAHEPQNTRARSLKVVETLSATFCISVFPVGIIYFVPLTSTVNGKSILNKQWLKALLAFAVGGLLGDVFLHLLPHALAHSHTEDHHEHSHSDHHDHSSHTIIGLQVLCGMLCFFLIEKMAVLHNASTGHGHSHGNKNKGNQRNRKDDSKEEKESKESESEKITRDRFKVAAFLNIIADTVHNLTDGMAIAASFTVSQNVGLGTTVAVMIHEIPHEIGDLAILIQSGMSKNEVIKVQLLTAVGAMIGAIIGLFLGTQSDSSWIIPFTAGGFIYIATADVIPQLFEKTNVIQTIKEIIAMTFGVSAMLLITYLE